MSDNPQAEYLRSQILTASPVQLQMMLYDGAIRFCEQAREAMTRNDIPTLHDRLLRAQRIVLELSSSMRNDVDPELCGRLASLYNYVYRLLVDANFNKDPAALGEAGDLLRFQRETWKMLLNRLQDERAGQIARSGGQQAQTRVEHSDADRPAGGSLSVEG